MNEFQTEVVDSLDSEQINVTINSGSTYIITSSAVIRSVYMQLPKRGSYANSYGQWVDYSMNGGAEWTTLERGSRFSVQAYPKDNEIHLTTTTGSAKVQVVLLTEPPV